MKNSSSMHWFDALTEADTKATRRDDPARCYRVLVTDLVGLQLDQGGEPDCSVFAAHVRSRNARFQRCVLTNDELTPLEPAVPLDQAGIAFEYCPELSREDQLLNLTAQGRYDAVIAAATRIPHGASFAEGGVRIGAGTANMASRSFTSGVAPLMNTPGFNTRATAQMVFKALLRVLPDLPLEHLHERVSSNTFDTGLHLKDFPTRKLEGLRFAVLGFGNIGREVALLARSFGMQVAVYGRAELRPWIEAEGFEFAATPATAANGAAVISPHLGLGSAAGKGFANEGVLNRDLFKRLAPGAVVINFDRGELLEVSHLADALRSGQIKAAAVDADVFLESDSPGGPLRPYLSLLPEFGNKLLLLPHAAADTDHPSRVAGALQAADQIIAAIRFHHVINAVGSLPEQYTDGGAVIPPAVGRVSRKSVDALHRNKEAVTQLRAQLAVADEWLASVQNQSPGDSYEGPDVQHAILACNRFATAMRQLGLTGPGTEI